MVKSTKGKAATIGVTMLGTLLVIIFIHLTNASAGDLEPTDPPGPTMKTLNEIHDKPVWRMLHKVFADWPSNPRFAVCDNGTPGDSTDDIVLDKATGLMRPRDGNIFNTDKGWQDAVLSCHNLALGYRKGWRLPTIEELSSLFDISQGSPALPSGHPFINVQNSYWSSTTYDFNTTHAYSVAMSNGNVSHVQKENWPNVWAWPVRGGNGYAIHN